ncbi:MAG: DUF885 family protein [Proteobacteria bacterium]|nr:DUF885 family protein [Pseudomonadota bacterium]
MHRRTFLTAGSAVSALSSTPALAQAVNTVATGTPDGRLRALLDRFHQAQLERNPEEATAAGLDAGVHAARKSRLNDRSPEARTRRLAEARRELAQLTAIPRGQLSPAARVDQDVVRYALEREIGDISGFVSSPGSPYALSQLTGAYQSGPDFLDSQHTVKTRGDAEAYLLRLNALGTAIDQDLARQRQEAAAGVIPPDYVLDIAIAQTQALRAAPAGQSGLARSVGRRAREAGVAGDWTGQAAPIVERSVYPALDRQLVALRTLRARARPEPGAWRLPKGRELYARAVQAATTTNLTPAQIHTLGREQVRQISAQMDAILRAQGLTQGPVGARVVEMSRRPDQLYPNTDAGREALLASLNDQIQGLQPKLPQLFGTLPKASVEVRRVPPAIQDGAPNGYYQAPTLDGSRPGIYWINLKTVTDWPRFSLPTLTYHEANPGHHLQITVAQENEAIPLIRRTAYYSAHGEGWALYSEQLADEIGAYADNPLGRLGFLQALLYRAARLVVDTGLHDLRWSRERATREFIDITGFPEGRAQREVDRYSVWPGQATSYKVGHNTWLRLRDKAKARLGSRFDIRAFHDAALAGGSMPLTVLERVVDEHIAARAGRAA